MQVWKAKQEGTQAEKAFIQPQSSLQMQDRVFFFPSSPLVGLKLAGSILVTRQTTKQKGIVPADTPELAPQTLLTGGFLGIWLSPGIRESTPQAALWDGSCCGREEHRQRGDFLESWSLLCLGSRSLGSKLAFCNSSPRCRQTSKHQEDF